MRSWQRELAIADAQMRAEYYRALIERALLPPRLARIHTEQASIEDMKVYLEFEDRLYGRI
jgi:hypothetical protein